MAIELDALATEVAAMQHAAEQIDDPAFAHFALQVARHCQWALDGIAARGGIIDDQIRWWPAWNDKAGIE
ncbi:MULTISPECIES: hypothetical protein [unclassified Sphingomonas]|uniref:hypothetical protein n=1 Tax=unclassified Sphingomonas TaxID=196159 RepID=UPI001F59E1C5|nr:MULTISPECIES: hypothetical protein [unclassified Sphingomonas]